jgi:REP element-mobilizing transposase RayT
VVPLSYLLTFSTYGTHLPGSEKGWVDARHAAYGRPAMPANQGRQDYWRSHLREAPWTMNAQERGIVLEALLAVCAYRQWSAHAIQVRTTHVHAVVSGVATPERMLSDFKAYSTRALRGVFQDSRRKSHWGRHGSTRYLWNEISVRAAVEYVLNGQGERMALYPDPDFGEPV